MAAATVEERLLPAALVIAGLFWPVRWLAHRRLSVRTPADWPVGLLAALLPVTLWATALPEVTRGQVLALLLGMALYYAVANWAATQARVRWAAWGLVALGLGLALAAPWSVAGLAGGRLPAAGGLAASLAGSVNPNILAAALALLLPLALAPLLFDWRGTHRALRALALAGALAMAAVLGLSRSQGAWAGAAAAVALLVVLRWRLGWLLLPAAALAGGLALWRLGPAAVLDGAGGTQWLGGLDSRLEVWSRGLYMVQDFPFTGIGMGSFRQVADLLYPFFLAGPGAEIPHAHNLFLQVAVDLGLPGLIAWSAALLLAVAAAWQALRLSRAAGERRPAGLAAGLLAGQAALIVHGLTDAATWGTRPAVIVWALWGLSAAALAAPAGREAAADG